MEKVKQTSE